MNDPQPEQPEAKLDADLEMSPFRLLVTEAHEIYSELNAVGFPESATVQIIAHMLSDAVFSRLGYGEVAGEDEDDDGDDDTDGDGDFDSF